ncbi:hypothetical protein [Cupriavidus plantarum]|nr:hypothetical protein [Cupriavidus plantarum]
MRGIVRRTVSGLPSLAVACACMIAIALVARPAHAQSVQSPDLPQTSQPASQPASQQASQQTPAPADTPKTQDGVTVIDMNAALTRLIRAMNVTRLMTVGMDRAFARMPDKVGPIPKDKLAACAHAKLTPEMLEQVVRPAFALTFTEPMLPTELSVVFESRFGTKMIDLVLQNKTVDRSSFTADEVEEMNRFAQSPEISAFLRDNGFARLMRSITPYIVAAGSQARDACVRELVPREVPVTNPRPA